MSFPSPKGFAIVAALEREIHPLVKHWRRAQRDYAGRSFTFFEHENVVAVCGGIGLDAARRAAEAVITLYHPTHLHSVGFAGALDSKMQVADIFSPNIVIDARDGSRHAINTGHGTLLSFGAVASSEQKAKLRAAYAAQAIDMEAAAVASAARAHNITSGATKVISDELNFEIPAMDRFITADGRFQTARFALFTALRPWLWRRVARLASNSRRAAHVLGAHLNRMISETTDKMLKSETDGLEINRARGRE